MKINTSLVAEIINRHLESSEFLDLSVESNDFSPETLNGKISFANVPNSGLFTSILNRISPDRRNERRLYYHFKRPEHILHALQSRALQASSLPSHDDNHEYTEYHRRTGLIDDSGNFIDLPSEDGKPMRLMPIEENRKWIFILSFTRNLGNPRFWKDYAVDGTGAALVLDVFTINEDPAGRRFFELRDVAYETSESSDRFGFIRRIQSDLKDTLGAPLLLSRVPAIAAHYKQHRFKWEDETRLKIDVQYNFGSFRTPSPIGALQNIDGDRVYINVPISPIPFNTNKMFRVLLRGLILGPNVGNDEKKMRQLMRQNFPACFIAANDDEARDRIKSFEYPEYVDEDEVYMRALG